MLADFNSEEVYRIWSLLCGLLSLFEMKYRKVQQIRQLAIKPVAFQESQRENESFPFTLKPQFHIYQ